MSRELDEKELGQISGGQAAAVSRLRCGHFSIATLSACDPPLACARLRTRRAVGFAPLAQRWRSRSPRLSPRSDWCVVAWTGNIIATTPRTGFARETRGLRAVGRGHLPRRIGWLGSNCRLCDKV